jgi:hypothetical protein
MRTEHKRHVEELVLAGMQDPERALKMSDAIFTALDHWQDEAKDELATKNDILELKNATKNDILLIKNDILKLERDLIKWMFQMFVTVGISSVAIILGGTYFMLTHFKP